MNLRGRFLTDAEGWFQFRSVKPAGYPVPTDGRSATCYGRDCAIRTARRIFMCWPTSWVSRR